MTQLIRLLLCFLICHISVVTWAAEPDSNVVNVDLASISTAIEQSALKLQGFKPAEFYEEERHDLDSVANEFTQDVETEFSVLSEAPLADMAKTKFESISSNWAKIKLDYTDELESVQKDIDKLTLNLVTLEAERKKWQLTLEERKDEETPEIILIKIKETLEEISRIEKEQNKALTWFIEIETKWLVVSDIITQAEELLTTAQSERSKQVFVQNAPAIWHVTMRDSVTRAEDTVSIMAKLRVSLIDENAHTTANFFEENKNSVYLHLVMMILLLVVAYRYSRKSFTYPKDSRSFLIEAIYLVREGWHYAAIYLGIISAMLWYDYIPVLLVNIAVIIAILLMIAIFKAHRDVRFVRVTIVLCFLYILGQFSAESVYTDLALRLFLIIKVFIAFAALRVFLKGLVNIGHVRGMQFLGKFSKALSYGYIVLAVSLLANILGYIQLGNLLTLLVINVCVVTFLFYGIVVNSNGLIALMLRTTWSPHEVDSINFRDTMERNLLKVVNFLAFWFWLRSVLGSLGIYNYIANFLTTLVSTNIEVGTVNISLQEIFYALVVGIFTFILARFIGIFISEGGLNKFNFKRGVPKAISLVVRYTVIFLGSMLALAVAGIDLSSFGLLAGALGIGIGFGLQNIISNFVAGLILVFERPLQEGDVVEVNSLLGEVRKIGIRSSNIRTYSGSEVVVPNETLIAKELINWTLSDSRKRVEVLVGVDYGTDPRKVMELLEQAAAAYSEVLTDPAPKAFFQNFGDSALEFRLLFWVQYNVGLSSKSEVMVNITDLFNENNINIPFPIRTLKIEKEVGDSSADPRTEVDI